MTATEQQFIDTIRKCKTNINNMYWGFLLSKQHELWQTIATQYKKKYTNNPLHIVAFLYKLYLRKPIKHVTPKQQLVTPKPELVTPKQQQVSTKPELVTPKPELVTPKQQQVSTKQKFRGAYRHTAGSNYKEWKKSQKGIKTHEKIETKIFNKWKIEDNFDPKKYNKTVPWFEYIDTYMD